MAESTGYKFEIPKHHRCIIKVIGVGGGGGNAVNHMHKHGICDVEFIVANTDLQALNNSPVPCKIQLGTSLTEGLGCGSDPGKGKASAEENKDELRELLAGTKMVFITAGMGGGTGTGAAPVIAKIAKDMDILTVGIVTVPFSFEGRKKMEQAMKGVEAMRASCDTVLVVLNDKLREIFGSITLSQGFSEADNVLTTAAKGIAEIITLPGYINVDFQDVRTVMFDAGSAVMGSAETRGENRAITAAKEALASPLLNNHDIMGAKRILLSITSGEDQEMTMDELSDITEYIQGQAGDEAEMKFGHSVDSEMGDRVRVTVIATGFDANIKTTKQEPVRKVGEVGRVEGQLPDFDTTAGRPSDQRIELKPKPAAVQQEITFGPPKVEKKTEKPVEKELPPFTFNIEPKKEPPVEKEVPYIFNFEPKKEPEFIDEFDLGKGKGGDQVINNEGMMDWRRTKSRLEEQRRERSERLKGGRPLEMTKEDFEQKLTLPAYIRRSMKLEDTPHSSEMYMSRYNLNDDNNIVKNNKFFHDNVD